jgi:hypothetical protein
MRGRASALALVAGGRPANAKTRPQIVGRISEFRKEFCNGEYNLEPSPRGEAALGTYERDALTHRYLAGHGYAAVRVDIRGSGESGGKVLQVSRASVILPRMLCFEHSRRFAAVQQ